MEAPDKPQQLLSPRGAMKAAAIGLDGRWKADVASSALCGAWRRGLRGRGVAPLRLVAALLMSRSHLGSRCDISTAIAGHRVNGRILGEQLAAVKDVSAGLVTVSAGPGSGKTRTLVARVLELVQAADELRKRLRDALGATAAEEVVLGTFHSLSARLLRQHFQLVDRGAGASGGSRLAGLRKDFRVLEVWAGQGGGGRGAADSGGEED
eukprot:XP_001700952.1 predicted protein [Chlamydomonas reinhardtii]